MITISIKLRKEKQNVEIYPFDSDEDVLKRYVVSIENEEKFKIGTSSDFGSQTLGGLRFNIETLPQFLKFIKIPLEFTEGKTYKIEDIRDEIINLNLKNVVDVNTLANLKSKYNLIDTQTIIYLWFIVNDFTNMTKEQFSEEYERLNIHDAVIHLHNRSLVTASNLYDAIVKFKNKAPKMISIISSSLKRENKIYKNFRPSSLNNIETSTFDTKEITEDVFLHLPNDESLYYVFDLFSVSKDLPFIMLFDEGKTFFKIYQDFIPPDSWINFNPNNGLDNLDVKTALFLYVYNKSTELVQSSITPGVDTDKYTKKYFTIAKWSSDNSIRIPIIMGEIDNYNNVSVSDVIKEKLLNSLRHRLTYTIINTAQVNIRGKFTILKETFNRAIFADLIMNDPNISYFLFMDEHEKSALDKPRFAFYFDHNQQGIPYMSLTITLTPNRQKNNVWIDVRVSRAKTLKQVNNFISIFKNIFAYYINNSKNVIDKYKDLYKDIDFQKFHTLKKAKIKVDTKSGVRLKALEEFNPEAFKGGYATKCQPTRRQPYLVNENNIKSIKKKFESVNNKTLEENLKKYGLLNWPKGSKDWYACYPREPTDDSQAFIWPGFVCLGDKKQYRPCCFKINQFTKKGGLVDYQDTGKFKCNGEAEDIVTTTTLSRPLNSNKHVTPGKFGDVLYYMQIIASYSNMKTVKIKTKIGLPILRYGVMDGPDSFVHCIEAATHGEEYFKLTSDQKRERVKNELNEISEKPDSYFVVVKQELYDYNYYDIKKHLTKENSYIDPDIYLPLFEKRNDCNIIVFECDNENPNGELSTQRYSVAYLPYKPTIYTEENKRNTIVIVKFQTDEHQYQCELVVKYDKTGIQYMFDDSDPFIEACFKIREDINNVYMTCYEGTYKKITATVKI